MLEMERAETQGGTIAKLVVQDPAEPARWEASLRFAGAVMQLREERGATRRTEERDGFREIIEGSVTRRSASGLGI